MKYSMAIWFIRVLDNIVNFIFLAFRRVILVYTRTLIRKDLLGKKYRKP